MANQDNGMFTRKHCGKQYFRKPNRTGDQGKQYCSRECAFADVKAWITKQTTKKIKGYFPGTKCNVHIKECDSCNALFTTRRSSKRCCSNECHKEYLKRYDRDNHRRYNSVVEKTKQCFVCGKEFKTHSGNLTVCSRGCKDRLFWIGWSY